MPIIDRTDVSSRFAFLRKHDIIVSGGQLQVKKSIKQRGYLMENCSKSNCPAQHKAEVFTPANQVAYAEGAVVSRTIIENGGGTVTLISFDANQGLSEHTAPFDAMVCILDGEARITIGGKPHHLKTGESIIMPANVPHALDAVTAFKMMLIMIKA